MTEYGGVRASCVRFWIVDGNVNFLSESVRRYLSHTAARLACAAAKGDPTAAESSLAIMSVLANDRGVRI